VIQRPPKKRTILREPPPPSQWFRVIPGTLQPLYIYSKLKIFLRSRKNIREMFSPATATVSEGIYNYFIRLYWLAKTACGYTQLLKTSWEIGNLFKSKVGIHSLGTFVNRMNFKVQKCGMWECGKVKVKGKVVPVFN
jgi:hypothetical protein